MPTYEYLCTECGQNLETVQSFSDDPLTTCPVCGGRLRKVFGSVGIVLKGSGFYKTDNRRAAKGGDSGTTSSSSSSSSDTSSSSGDSGGSDGSKGSTTTPAPGSSGNGGADRSPASSGASTSAS